MQRKSLSTVYKATKTLLKYLLSKISHLPLERIAEYVCQKSFYVLIMFTLLQGERATRGRVL